MDQFPQEGPKLITFLAELVVQGISSYSIESIALPTRRNR